LTASRTAGAAIARIVLFTIDVLAETGDDDIFDRVYFQTCDEIAAMERSIREMELAIVAKDQYLQTVQTRQHLHNQRPNVENCRDTPQKS